MYRATDILANRGDRGTDMSTGSTPREVSHSQSQAGREAWGGTSLALSDGALISDFLRTVRACAILTVVLCYAALAVTLPEFRLCKRVFAMTKLSLKGNLGGP